jgi:hypothetical protein
MTARAQDTLTQSLLAEMPESHVLVLPGPPGDDGDELVAAWMAARDDAARAYEAWRSGAGPDDFAVWRAAADREDAAADALASRALERRTRWSRLLKGARH